MQLLEDPVLCDGGQERWFREQVQALCVDLFDRRRIQQDARDDQEEPPGARNTHAVCPATRS